MDTYIYVILFNGDCNFAELNNECNAEGVNNFKIRTYYNY